MSQIIPKRKVEVRIHLVTGECLPGIVFLDYIDVIHRGEQTLLDKFNDDYSWFAMNTAEGGGLAILNRDHVVYVESEAGLSPALVRKENSPVFRRERVTLRLPNDRTLTGRIAMDLPDEFSRVSDFLMKSWLLIKPLCLKLL